MLLIGKLANWNKFTSYKYQKPSLGALLVGQLFADMLWRDVQVRVEEDLKVIKYNKFWGQVLHVILT